jgi:hypothetical protein
MLELDWETTQNCPSQTREIDIAEQSERSNGSTFGGTEGNLGERICREGGFLSFYSCEF